MENTYKKIKTGFKNTVIAYAILTSIGMLSYTLTGEITGHRSADLALGKTKLSRLEKAILKPICDKVGCDVNEIDKPLKNK